MIYDNKELEFIKTELTNIPPEGCKFKVGDIVTFTNQYGASFKNRRVIGFSKDIAYPGAGRIHLNGDTPYWFPIHDDSLKLQTKGIE